MSALTIWKSNTAIKGTLETCNGSNTFLAGLKRVDISNKVGNISNLKIFVISSFRAPRCPVVLSAIYQLFDKPKIHKITETYLHKFR